MLNPDIGALHSLVAITDADIKTGTATTTVPQNRLNQLAVSIQIIRPERTTDRKPMHRKGREDMLTATAQQFRHLHTKTDKVDAG